MLLFNWLASVRNRLRVSRYFGSRRERTRPRGRRDVHSRVPAMIEVLEQRCVLSAVGAIDDVFTVSVSGSSQPTQLNVLANDFSSAGGLQLSAVGSAAHGTISIDQSDPTQLPSLIYTADVGFIGVETFDYTVMDADGDSAFATVTVTVGGSNPYSNSGSTTGVLTTATTVIDSYVSQIAGAVSGGVSGGSYSPYDPSWGTGSTTSSPLSSSGTGSSSGGTAGNPENIAGTAFGSGSTSDSGMASSGLPSNSGGPTGGSTYATGFEGGFQSPSDPTGTNPTDPSGYSGGMARSEKNVPFTS